LYVSVAGQRIKAWVKERFGEQSVRAIKRRLKPLGSGHVNIAAAPGPTGAPNEIAAVGINLTGYVRAESGMGEGARSLIRAMEAVTLPHTVADLDLNVLSRMDDHSAGEVSGDYEYGINLFVVNADQVGAVMDHVGPGRLEGRHNVGFWLWEQEHFPRRWLGAFDHFCELWTPSRFCMDALSAVAPVPVRRVPLTVEAKASSAASRTNFELPQEAFLVLFIFDFLSYFERKNPIALVQAFRRAFENREDVVLVLKTANTQHNPEAFAALQREMTGVPVRLIDRYLSRQEIFDLMAVCDCYASLHRSDGFGHTIAEAMSLGKPVVATDYSGNTDFMHPGNSLPVGYELVTLERDSGPYARGSLWADPDVDHAAELLRRVYDDRDLASRLGERGRRDVTAQLSRIEVGEIMRERVVEILRRTPQGIGLTHPAALPRSRGKN
jgi:glycosyltransferase involved in cell wall biosynthesis